MYGASSAVSSQIPTYLNKFSTNKDPNNTSLGGNQAMNLGAATTTHASAKFNFKNFIGDGLEKYNESDKSGTDLSGIDEKSTTSQKENIS